MYFPLPNLVLDIFNRAAYYLFTRKKPSTGRIPVIIGVFEGLLGTAKTRKAEAGLENRAFAFLYKAGMKRVQGAFPPVSGESMPTGLASRPFP